MAVEATALARKMIEMLENLLPMVLRTIVRIASDLFPLFRRARRSGEICASEPVCFGEDLFIWTAALSFFL